jgi:glycerate kinase
VPCIAVALDVQIGNREMRTMGVEAAYPVVEASTRDGQPVVSAGQLAAAAARVARTWRW